MAASSRSPLDRKLAYTVSTETPAARATSRIPVAAHPRSPNRRAAAEATIDRVSAACCSRRGPLCGPGLDARLPPCLSPAPVGTREAVQQDEPRHRRDRMDHDLVAL